MAPTGSKHKLGARRPQPETVSPLDSEAAGGTLTVRVPLTCRRHGGRKVVVTPDGSDWTPTRHRIDNVMVKALARAHRWSQLLEAGEFASLTDLARAENIDKSYLSKILRLTLLAPDLIERILNGEQPPTLQMDRLLQPFEVEWREQSVALLR